jgi:hypothetical protein
MLLSTKPFIRQAVAAEALTEIPSQCASACYCTILACKSRHATGMVMNRRPVHPHESHMFIACNTTAYSIATCRIAPGRDYPEQVHMRSTASHGLQLSNQANHLTLATPTATQWGIQASGRLLQTLTSIGEAPSVTAPMVSPSIDVLYIKLINSLHAIIGVFGTGSFTAVLWLSSCHMMWDIGGNVLTCGRDKPIRHLVCGIACMINSRTLI